MKTCENCGSLNNNTYGSGRFCSAKCARGFSSKAKRTEINEKVSKKLTGRMLNAHPDVSLICKFCDKQFTVPYKKRKQKCCSSECGRKFIWTDKNTRKILIDASKATAIRRHQEGDPTIGWVSRKNRDPSFPETVFMSLMNEYKIEFEREKKVGKYFIDFAIKNIALEIDGRHHNDPNIQSKDKIRDKFLSDNGWIVYRIKWQKLQLARIQFEEFLNWYNEKTKRQAALGLTKPNAHETLR